MGSESINKTAVLIFGTYIYKNCMMTIGTITESHLYDHFVINKLHLVLLRLLLTFPYLFCTIYITTWLRMINMVHDCRSLCIRIVKNKHRKAQEKFMELHIFLDVGM
jgi:hypothetical protein